MLRENPPAVASALAAANTGLAGYFAARFIQQRPEDREEILSDALYGVVRASQRYDASRGRKFSTYAQFYIFDSIIQGFHARDIVTTPCHKRPLQGAAVTVVISPRLADPKAESASERRVVIRESAETVSRLLAQLSPRQAHVLILRYGLDGQGERTLKNIGRTLRPPICQEAVRMIEIGALARLRDLMKLTH